MFWCGLLVVAVSTLGPIGLRPETRLPPAIERWAAFLIIGLPLTIAYPRQRVAALFGLILVAGGFEVLQGLVPGRHGRLGDFEAKTLGVVTGAALGLALEWVLARVGAVERDVASE